MGLIKKIWIVLCALLGAAAGALLIGMEFSSLWMSAVGAVIGLFIGWMLGKYIPIYEWFT